MVYNPLMIEADGVTLDIVERGRPPSGFKILSVTNFDYPTKVGPLSHALRHWIDSRFLEENDITWSIVGAGALFERFKDEVDLPSGENRVTFYGFRRDVAEFYKSHHVFAHLSGFDSLPNVALEAAVHGLPIIALPQSGGTLEAMRDGETGRVVSDGEAFRRVILEYRDSPELRREHGRNGRAFILENFTIEQQAAKMAALLAERFGIGVE